MNWTELLFKSIMPLDEEEGERKRKSSYKMTHPPVESSEEPVPMEMVLAQAKNARKKKASAFNDLSEALENGDLDLIVEFDDGDE